VSFHVFRCNGQALLDDAKRRVEVLILDFVANSWLPFVASLSNQRLCGNEQQQAGERCPLSQSQ
jgi:hypothetical protein